jgi:hypothetical protein
MQAVFLDTIGGSATGGALAAQPPAELVDRDVIAIVKFGSGELEGSGHCVATATDYGDFDRLLPRHADPSLGLPGHGNRLVMMPQPYRKNPIVSLPVE